MLRANLPRTHPAGRINQERFHGKLGGTAKRRLDAELRWDDPNKPTWSVKRPPIEFRLDGRGHEWMDPPEQPTEHDESWVQEIDQTGEADADPASGLLQRP